MRVAAVVCRYSATKAAISVIKASTVVLAESGLGTIITSPGSPRNATYVAYVYSHNITASPSARWIWDGPGNNAGCNPNITIEHNFTIRCLNEPLKAYVSADNSYTCNILGVSGAGNDWRETSVYTVPTTGMTCRKNILTQNKM